MSIVVERDPDRPSIGGAAPADTPGPSGPRARSTFAYFVGRSRRPLPDGDAQGAVAGGIRRSRRSSGTSITTSTGNRSRPAPTRCGTGWGSSSGGTGAAVAAAVAVAILLVGTIVFYTARLARARNLAVAEATRTQRIQRYLVALFEGGDEAVGPADSLRVVTLVDRGIAEAGDLEGDPVVQAELFQTLGTISRQLGNLPRADSLLTLALQRRRALHGPSASGGGRGTGRPGRTSRRAGPV